MNKNETVENLDRIFSNILTNDNQNENDASLRRFISKYLELYQLYGNAMMDMILSDTDLIDEDMFKLGTIINDKYLYLVVQPLRLSINLSSAISNALLHHKPSFIRLLLRLNIDISKIESNIMIMCVETEEYDLLREFINRKYDISVESYRALFTLAAKGELDLVKHVVLTYRFHNIPEIIFKICIQAVYNNHVPILEYFFTEEVFIGAPDQMFDFFINSIKYKAKLPIIKFFTSKLNIKQKSYLAVYTAIKMNADETLKHFCEIDDNVINILTPVQKEKLGLIKRNTVDQYIGLNRTCGITYQPIGINDTYLQCENLEHVYLENNWNEWNKINPTCLCPACSMFVKKTIYVNRDTSYYQSDSEDSDLEDVD